MTTLAPSIRLASGVAQDPPGWMWVLAFAVKGVPWAMADVLTAEFKAGMMIWHRARLEHATEELIRLHEEEIASLCVQLEEIRRAV